MKFNKKETNIKQGTPPWIVTSEKVELAIQKIVNLTHPLKIILFGSYVKNNISKNSDLDILIVTAYEVKNPIKEIVKIRRYLRDVLMPMDILIISQKKLTELKDIPGLIYREILKHGKIVYEEER